MIVIDGSEGEGGGQILRSSLALSALTGVPLHVKNIRAGRSKPGLLRQHRTAVLAAAEVCGGEVEGAELRSAEIVLRPGRPRAGDYRFAVGTAGSANLVLQTVLPILTRADGPSTVVVEGGTHNPSAPSSDFLRHTFAKALAAFGPQVDVELERHGFYPAGGGRVQVTVQPKPYLPASFEGPALVQQLSMRAAWSMLEPRQLHRFTHDLGKLLGIAPEHRTIEEVPSQGPGMVVAVVADTETLPMWFTRFPNGRSRWRDLLLSLEQEVRTWRDTNVLVDQHLADQLLIPMALAGGGSFRTVKPSLHTRTNMEVIARFLPVRFHMETLQDNSWRIAVV